MQQGRFVRSLAIRAVRISHLRIKIIPKGMKWTTAGEICTQSRDSHRQDFTFAYKNVAKGMKWTTVGKIYTQSRDSRRQDFTFAYKKGC